MSGSTGYRIEIAIIDNSSDADGATATITRRGDTLTTMDLEEAFTAALRSVGFHQEVSID